MRTILLVRIVAMWRIRVRPSVRSYRVSAAEAA
jgi:hypothetical protein